jgi:dipeptidyl aminopeptidase/acylaminoacyl peptidase
MIPRKVLFGNPERMLPQISPDGKTLAWIAPQNGVLNVWVRALSDSAAAGRCVTADPKRGIRQFFWQEDSQHLLYLQDKDGDENWHLFQISTGGNSASARDLTPGELQARVIARSSRFPDQLVVALNKRDARFHDAYLLNLNSAELKLLAENPGDVEYYIADHRFQVRAALARLADGAAEIRVRDDDRSPWRRLTGWSADDVDGELLSFSSDDQEVWYTSSVASDLGQLLATDIRSQKTHLLMEDREKQFDAGKILVQPESHKLEAVQFNRERNHWEPFGPALRADFDILQRTHRGDFEILSRDRADRLWTVAYNLDDGPTTFYLYSRATRKAEFLFADRPELARYQLAQMEPVTFKARDGLLLHAYLTLPAVSKPEQRKLPLIVYPHGGPYDRDSWGYDDSVQLFANRGYAVLQINYRASTGYGKKFLQAGFRERGGKMSTDLLDGKSWAIDHGYADPQKTCIYGVSYGGYAVLIAAAFTPDEFVCGVESYGASNLVSLLKSFPPYWALYRRQWERRVGRLEEEEFLKSRSALFKVDQIKAPLLVGQGVNDPRVVKAESDQMVAALRKAGKKVEYIVFPDEGHGFVRPENRAKWFAATEAFLANQLGGRAEPPSSEEEWKTLEQ